MTDGSPANLVNLVIWSMRTLPPARETPPSRTHQFASTDANLACEICHFTATSLPLHIMELEEILLLLFFFGGEKLMELNGA